MIENNKAIKNLAMKEFFQTRHGKTLSSQFQAKDKLDLLLKIREFPLKYGVWLIIKDQEEKHAANYPIDPISRFGFEFLKILHDINQVIDDEEKRYIKIQINDCINGNNKDLSPIMLELRNYYSMKKSGINVSIGDKNKSSDLTVIHESKTYNIECKSVKLGDDGVKSLQGLCSVMEVLFANSEELEKMRLHTAWQILDIDAFMDDDKINIIKNKITEYINVQGGSSENFQTQESFVRFLGEANSVGHSILDFLKIIEKEDNMANYMHVISREICSYDLDNSSSWSHTFYKLIDVDNIIDRCMDSFHKAMKQHSKLKTDNRIVYISIEEMRVFEDISSEKNSTFEYSKVEERMMSFITNKLEEKIKQDGYWKRCLGVGLIFFLPARINARGIFWPKSLTWISPSGKPLYEDFPALKLLKEHV